MINDLWDYVFMFVRKRRKKVDPQHINLDGFKKLYSNSQLAILLTYIHREFHWVWGEVSRRREKSHFSVIRQNSVISVLPTKSHYF